MLKMFIKKIMLNISVYHEKRTFDLCGFNEIKLFWENV